MAGHHTRHRDRQRTEHVAILDDGGPGEEIVVDARNHRIVIRIETARRLHPELDAVSTTFRLKVDHHEAATTEAAHPWLHRPDRKPCCHRGIDRIAAVGQHLGPDVGCNPVLARDETSGGGDRRFGNGPRLLKGFVGHGPVLS